MPVELGERVDGLVRRPIVAAKQTDYPPDLEDVAIALSDVDLVGRVYQVVDVLDDDPGANELYFLLTEAFER